VEIDKSFVANRPRTVYALTDSGREALGAYKRDVMPILEALPD
jgi:DNA-binding PadR family transcriptional regulator